MTSTAPPPSVGAADPSQFVRLMADREAPPTGSTRIALNPEDVRDGLGKLVLTLLELLRELLERQAIRRIEGGSLTDVEIERLGATFLGLSQQIDAMKSYFGLEGQELNLDLGPLGKLI